MLPKPEVDALFELCKKGDLPVNTLTPETITGVRDSEDKSLLDVAIMSKHDNLVKELITRASSALSNTTLQQAIRSAVVARDVKLVQEMYQLVDTIYRDRYDAERYKQYRHDIGSLALIEACKHGLEDIVRFFLDKNTAYPGYGLEEAWVHGHLNVVDMLIEAGAYEHWDETGRFAVDVMERSFKLLGNSLTEATRTKLINHLALRGAGAPEAEMDDEDEDADYVEYYYSLGRRGTETLARCFVLGREEHTPLDIHNAMAGAVYGGNVGTFQYFMSFAQVRGFPVDAQAFFDSALGRGSSSIAERLFTAYKIDLAHCGRGVKDRDQRLVYAAACGSVMLLFTILRCAGQDVNCVVKLGWPHSSDACTALSRASDPDTIRFLLDAKADVNSEGCDTVLRGACEKLRPDAVKALLAAGAEVNRVGSYEGAMSALHYAVYAQCPKDRVSDQIKVINMLLDAGADTRNCGGSKSVLEPGKLSQFSSYHLDAAFAAVLARDPGLVHCRDVSGATPLLQVLRQHKDPALVKVLLDAKADVNAVDNDGNTALSQLAVEDDGVTFGDRASMRRVFQLLVSAGADLTQCVEGKDTALTRLMGPDRRGYQRWSSCVEWGPNAGRGILTDILDAILYRPVADEGCAMTD